MLSTVGVDSGRWKPGKDLAQASHVGSVVASNVRERRGIGYSGWGNGENIQEVGMACDQKAWNLGRFGELGVFSSVCGTFLTLQMIVLHYR